MVLVACLRYAACVSAKCSPSDGLSTREVCMQTCVQQQLLMHSEAALDSFSTLFCSFQHFVLFFSAFGECTQTAERTLHRRRVNRPCDSADDALLASSVDSGRRLRQDKTARNVALRKQTAPPSHPMHIVVSKRFNALIGCGALKHATGLDCTFASTSCA